MGYRAKPEELIRYYERQFPLIHGNTGTSVWGPGVCFRQWGFPVKMEAKRNRFDALAKEADVCILFFYWRRGWKLGAHFAMVEHTADGFIGYNTFRNSKGPDRYGASLEAFLKEKKYFGAVLTAIWDKK